MAGSDYIFVQLTEFGASLAAGHPLRVSGRTSVVFTPGTPTRVAGYEWDLMLKDYETAHGNPLFEVVPAPAEAAVAAVSKNSQEAK